MPQVPQLELLVAVSTQVPLQRVGVADGHAHAPPVQVCAPGHAIAHEAQFVAVPSIVSQPLPALPSQFARPAAHTHAPDVQICPTAHDIPHTPQLLALVWVFTQVVPQSVDVGA